MKITPAQSKVLNVIARGGQYSGPGSLKVLTNLQNLGLLDGRFELTPAGQAVVDAAFEARQDAGQLREESKQP